MGSGSVCGGIDLPRKPREGIWGEGDGSDSHPLLLPGPLILFSFIRSAATPHPDHPPTSPNLGGVWKGLWYLPGTERFVPSQADATVWGPAYQQ